jgi:hypothetical protein
MKNIFTSTFLFLAVTAFAQDTKKDSTALDYGARIYDARIGRSMSVDPKSSQNNPYDFAQTTQKDSTLTFKSLLQLNMMSFDAPKNYIEIKPIENRQMNFEKAYKHPTERFEVRYAIRNNELNIPKQVFEMTVLNISGGLLPEYTAFNAEAAKNEFGANAGATVIVEVGKEFGQDYKYCLLVYIHKDGVGDGYIFYLADDKKIITDLMMPIFHALKFKTP